APLGGDARLDIARDGIEIDLRPEDVVDPADDARQIGRHRHRGLELLAANLPDLPAADREIRVQKRWLEPGETLRKAVRPASESPSRIGILEPLGRRVTECDVARERRSINWVIDG